MGSHINAHDVTSSASEFEYSAYKKERCISVVAGAYFCVKIYGNAYRYNTNAQVIMNELLKRLSGVRETGNAQWIARCPAHDDKSPSLSVKQLSDGRILIHCHAGCSGADVMHAAGLTLSDLYPDGSLGEFKPNWHMRRAKVENDRERAVLAMAEADRRAGKRLSQADLERERQAWLALRGRGSL